MRKQKTKKDKLLDSLEDAVSIGILSQAILTTLPHVVNTTYDDIKKIVANLLICSGELFIIDYFINFFRDEKTRKFFSFLFENRKKETESELNFNPKQLCEESYKCALNLDYDGFIESCIKLTSILSYDENAKALVKKLAYNPSLSAAFAHNSRDKDKRDAVRFLFSLMKGEDVLSAYEKNNISRFDEHSLLNLYLLLYNKKYDSASNLLESVLKDPNKYTLSEIGSSKNEVLELRFKNYNSRSFILKTLAPSVLKEYSIEKMIFSNLSRKNTPVPLGLLNLNGKDYFVQEVLVGKPFEKEYTSLEDSKSRKLFFKTLDSILNINLELSEKSNLINLSDVVEKINYEQTIVNSFRRANKDSLEILLDKLYPVLSYLSQGSDSFNHGDFHLGNIIVSNGEPLIIDFEKAMISTKYFDYLFFVGQPAFKLSSSDEKEIINQYLDYQVKDNALFYSTGLFVNLIITTRSSKWYQKEQSLEYKSMEAHFLSKTLEYLNKVPFLIDKELVKNILIDEFGD